jgi:very-short-patch-repair endonuclease
MARKQVTTWTPQNLERVRHLRNSMSQSEKKLWQRLRRNALGVRFRRQVPVGRYVLDFYCPAARLAVEVDGELHDPERDAARDAFMANLDIRTLRIPSWELFPPDDRTDTWVETIWIAVGRPESPT